MADEVGCARPTGKVLGQQPRESTPEKTEQEKEVVKMSVKVGQKAPDFESPAYHEGAFKSFKLSEYLGHWVLLCFYPGDFTFV